MTKLPFRPKDGFYLKDDFYGNDTVTDANLGELLWERVTIGNASTVAALVTTNTVAGRPGIVRWTTNGAADGDGEAVRLDEDTIVLKGGRPGSISFGFRYPDITGNQLAGNNFRIGLGDSVTTTSATVGIWADFDAGVCSLQADSADHGDVSASAAGVSTFTSGTTAVLGTWYDGEIRWSGTNDQGGPASAQLFINGELAAELNGTIEIDDDEEVEFGFQHWQDTGGSATLEWDLDYVDLYIGGRG